MIASYTLASIGCKRRGSCTTEPSAMRSRVTVVCLSVYVSITALTARVFTFAVQACYQQNQHDDYKVFVSLILLKVSCSKLMASFSFLIDMAIYDALSVLYYVSG